MAWIAENRRTARPEEGKTYLTAEMKKFLEEKYFPRYPTKRAVLLKALHLIQHAYNWIPMRAIEEVAEFLGVAPAEALDTATFYEEYWLKPKGKYLVQVCRSLACEICDSGAVTKKVCEKLNVEVGETTPDGKFTVVELECLGACGGAPAVLVNEVLYEKITPEEMERVLSELPDDPHNFADKSITFPVAHEPGADDHGH